MSRHIDLSDDDAEHAPKETTTHDLLGMLAKIFQPQPNPHPYKIGGKYFIRTVTHHHTGLLVAVTDQELVLEQAAWIADDGRFQQALEKGEFQEVEMFPKSQQVIIGRAAVIDAVQVSKMAVSQK